MKPNEFPGLSNLRFAQQVWLPPFLTICFSGMVLGGALVGSLMTIALYFSNIISSFWTVGIASYILITFVMFHFCEFTCAVLFRPHDCDADSFLFFHSPAFAVAHLCAWIEMLTKTYFYGDANWSGLRIIIFSILCIFFYMIRVKAMTDAGANFSFQVETEHRTTHRLVKDGIYSYFRHPSYFGSFYYFVFTQCLAGNWICMILFIFVLRFFFKQRIEDEESFLESEDFFGSEYSEYKTKTVVGIPIKNKYPFFC